MAVKCAKERYQGVSDRAQKLQEVARLFKICEKPDQTELKSQDDRKDAALEEPSVISLIECWEENGILYICTEICERGNLNEYLLQQLQGGESVGIDPNRSSNG